MTELWFGVIEIGDDKAACTGASHDNGHVHDKLPATGSDRYPRPLLHGDKHCHRPKGIPNRGGSSKLIERGSYRLKGASGVFTMRERGRQGGWETEVPQWGPGQSPGRGSVGQEAEAFLLMNA